jgi:hypothetical protein
VARAHMPPPKEEPRVELVFFAVAAFTIRN